MQQDFVFIYFIFCFLFLQVSFECVKRVEFVCVVIFCGGFVFGVFQQLVYVVGYELLYIIIVVGVVVVFFLQYCIGVFIGVLFCWVVFIIECCDGGSQFFVEVFWFWQEFVYNLQIFRGFFQFVKRRFSFFVVIVVVVILLLFFGVLFMFYSL